jgi:hypothetical protein
MREAAFDPGEFDDSLETISRLWAISLIYAGINRPVYLGPVAFHLTLAGLLAPFLLVGVNRLRQAAGETEIERPLRATVAVGVVGAVSLILWGHVAMLIALAGEVAAVFLFQGAMHRLAASHGAPDLARRWQRLRRSTAAASVLFLPAAVIVLGGLTFPGWLDIALIVPCGVVAASLLVRLAAATYGTRSWLQTLPEVGTLSGK